MIRALINSLRGWLASRATKGGFRDEPDDRQLGRVQMQLAQAAADYKAAKQRWPRDRAAVDRTWRQFRAARCAQISAEIGRSSSREISRPFGGVR